MKQLLVSATDKEITPFLDRLNQHPVQDLDVLITGVGGVATGYHLGRKLLQKSYDRIINVGVAGAFDRTLQLGQIVEITQDQFADLGAEEADGGFTDLFELQLVQDEFPFTDQKLINPKPLSLLNIPQVRGLSTNKVSGAISSIKKLYKKYPAQVETMESAAFFYCCIESGTPFVAVRTISNYVEIRNRENWKLGLAIKNLNQMLDLFFFKKEDS